MTPLLAKLFDDSDGFTARSYHTGLLWALEGIAWSPEYMPAAAETLMRLAEIDPGGRLSNRPSKSLADIFMPWYPQTSAPSARRVAVLRNLASRHPDHGRKLLLALLPSRMGVGTETHAPRFRQWRVAPKGVPEDYWQIIDEIVSILLELLREDPADWPALIEQIPELPGPSRGRLFSELTGLSGDTTLDQPRRAAIWEALDDMARQHRAFSDAKWALAEADVNAVETIASKFSPQDPVDGSKWLFDSSIPNTGTKRGDDFGEYQAEIDSARQHAVAGIVDRLGWSGIDRLIDVASESFAIGVAVADGLGDSVLDAILSLLDVDKPKWVQVAMGYAIRRAAHDGLAWIDEVIPRLTGRPIAQARILRTSTSFDEVWARVEALGPDVDRAYWAEFVPYGLGHDPQSIERIAIQLLAHDRPGAAADLLHLYVGRTETPLRPDLVAETLEAAVNANSPEITRLAAYGLQLLLDYLRSSNFDEGRLAVLEWQVFPALGYGARSPILERRLARDPAFFVDLVTLVYKRNDGAAEPRPPSTVTQNAFHLLHEWQMVPGSNERDGAVDEDQLTQWIADARRLLTGADREEIGLHQLGQVFAYSRTDPDGTWPTRPVRNAIESLANASLDAGFTTGTFNKRGVTSRGLTDGGRLEYDLAQHFDVIKERLMDEWPRTGRLVRSIAESYRAQGRMEDERARQFIEGLDR